MKRLLIALAAAVAVLTASARVTDTQSFEESFSDFVPSIENVDESELVDYDNNGPSFTAPYNFEGFGSKYLSLDTGDATLWNTNTFATADVYFDMALQFNPSANAPELEQGDPTKILLYQNTESNLVILAGETVGGPTTNYVTTTKVTPGTWARVTVSSELGNDGYTFKVRLDGTVLKTADNVESFPSRKADRTIAKVGISGSGALDNFVARTTDPYLGSWTAKIGSGEGEKYSTYSQALADALLWTTPPAITIFGETDPVDGSADHPYQIPTAASLMALQNAVLANPAARSLHYVQTANIDMSTVDGFTGIGTTDTSSASGGVPFSGTYDGGGYKISNVKFSWRKYAGIFNQVNGATIKNLIGENLGFSETGSGEHGCAMVGNGIATLIALQSQYTSDFSVTNTHNTGGIMVRAMGGTTFTSCTNTADLVCCRDKMGGICCFMAPVANTTVAFVDCYNSGSYTLVTPPEGSDYAPGSNGFAGILGYTQGAGDVTMQNCENTGSFVNELDTTRFSNDVFSGELIGKVTSSGNVTDLGGNKFVAANKVIGTGDSKSTFQYATVDNGVGTTVTTLEKNTEYLLLKSIAASETPVYAFDGAGTIAFDTALGYTFAGTVAAASNLSDVLSVTSSTEGTVTTYTATMGTVVATITKNDVTTSYSSLQNAIAAAVSGDVVNLIGAAGGAMNIPEGITVQLVDGYSLNDVTSLAGEGVLAMPSGVAPQSTVQLLCQQSTWAGTLYIHDVDIASAINLTLLGNANSTVRFNNAGCAFTTGSTTAHAIKALEIGPNGLDFVGNYSAGTFTFPCALTGTGMLKIAAKDSAYGTDHKVAKFTGDVSDFAGSISFDADANCAVYFGEAAGNGNCISVAAGSAVTVAAGKTWTAPSGFVVQGNMTVNGTLDAGSEKLYGSGTITFNAATSLIVANTWTGTYNANFKAANNAIFYIPVNASATTVINGANGEFGGYPKFGTGAPNVAGPVTLNANWTVANGWTGTDYTTTFAKLSGSGDLTVDGTTSGTDPIYYTITELNNYTGTLGGNRGNFTIGHVNVAEQPENGACVVKTAIGAHGAINDDVPLFVAGADTGKTLTYDANGADGAGLYFVAPAPSGFDGGGGATFNIPAETQTALAAKLPSGKTLADVADATSGMTYAQAYALGLMDEDTGDVETLKATIEFVGGNVKVSLDATANAAYTVTLKVYEKASLAAEWSDTPKATYTLGSAAEAAGFTPGSGTATAGFYKVEVSIAD